MNYPTNMYGSSVISAVDLYHVMNYIRTYPMNIYGSSVIYTIDLYHVMNYPMNIRIYKEVLGYYQVISCQARTCKFCYSCFYHEFTVL